MFRILLLLLMMLTLSSCASMSEAPVNPQLAQIDVELMTLELQSHQTAAARQHLLAAIQADPKSSEVMIAEGYFDAAEGDLHDATENYQAAIQAAPADPRIQTEYGSFLYHQGQYHQALAYFERAAQNPDNAASLEAAEDAALTAQKLNESNLAEYYFALVKERD